MPKTNETVDCHKPRLYFFRKKNHGQSNLGNPGISVKDLRKHLFLKFGQAKK